MLKRRTEGNPSIRHYAVCDIKRKQVERLRILGKNHPSFRVYEGDANERVHQMLKEAPITPKTACFCLIDQRTFECHWTTVEAVARHKREGYKVELFYFLAQKWLEPETKRSWRRGGEMAITRTSERFRRFRDELDYAYSVPFSIHEKGDGSRTMYYMIHASDHPAAAGLMARAYLRARPKEDGVALKFKLVSAEATPASQSLHPVRQYQPYSLVGVHPHVPSARDRSTTSRIA